jgi:hypothetical protein
MSILMIKQVSYPDNEPTGNDVYGPRSNDNNNAGFHHDRSKMVIEHYSR